MTEERENKEVETELEANAGDRYSAEVEEEELAAEVAEGLGRETEVEEGATADQPARETEAEATAADLDNDYNNRDTELEAGRDRAGETADLLDEDMAAGVAQTEAGAGEEIGDQLATAERDTDYTNRDNEEIGTESGDYLTQDDQELGEEFDPEVKNKTQKTEERENQTKRDQK